MAIYEVVKCYMEVVFHTSSFLKWIAKWMAGFTNIGKPDINFMNGECCGRPNCVVNRLVKSAIRKRPGALRYLGYDNALYCVSSLSRRDLSPPKVCRKFPNR